jgi:hypothetical protein
VRFYDDRPPVTYTMEIIWNYISAKIPIEKYREKKAFATIPVQINIDELLEEIRKRFVPRNNPSVLKRDWIKDALDEFVTLGLAKKLDGDKIYEIDIRKRTRKGVASTDFLLNLRYEPKKTESNGSKIRKKEGQMTFDDFLNK